MSVDAANNITTAAIFTTALASADRATMIDRCDINDFNHDSYSSWYQRYEYKICYFCTCGFYCPFEKDFCCVCGTSQDAEENSSKNKDIRHFASNVKESERLS